VKDLVEGMNDVPEKFLAIAKGLPYRDYMTVGVLVPHLNLKNETKIKTISNIVPDDWVYVHDKNATMLRFQIFNNWSPYLVSNPEKYVWIGLEYTCQEGDEKWNMSDKDFIDFAISEMVSMNIIDKDSVVDSHREKNKKSISCLF